jgi:hypothetical protein
MNKEIIRDNHGKTLGYKVNETKPGDSTYLDAGGNVIARVRNGTTISGDNRIVGRGDLGILEMNKK